MCKQFDWSLVESPVQPSVSVLWNTSGASVSSVAMSGFWLVNLKFSAKDISRHLVELIGCFWTLKAVI